jgi:polyhydroxybutyrate depolymerase
MRSTGALILTLCWLGAAQSAEAPEPHMPLPADCTTAAPCRVQDGIYLTHVPAGWDGKRPLPTMLYFHGYNGSAADEMADPNMIRFSDETGVLLVTPDGVAKSWSFPGSPEQARDDIAYVSAVLDDVERRYPVDRKRLWASGFSIGSSMVWYVACEIGTRFAAFGPVAGAFWRPIPQNCPAGPANIRHIHGLADKTMPMAGRPLRGGKWWQGDVRQGLAVWQKVDGCAAEPSRVEKQDGMNCEIWDRCSSGKQLQLCLHPGDHEISTDWLRDDFHWVDGLAREAKTAAAPGKASMQ